MFNSLLVPLDGSPFAEQALPLALSIARRAGGHLDLVRAHLHYALNDPPYIRLPYDPAEEAEWQKQEQLYLDATARWVTAESRVPVGTALVHGLVVDALLEHTQASKTDLIVMTTHGRGPFSRFFLGSVADELIRRTPVPILLTRPGQEAPVLFPEPIVQDVLILFDGSPLAEQVLQPAQDLSRLLEARCTLLYVVESGSVPSSMIDQRQEEAESYLNRLAARMREQSLQVRSRVAVAENAAEEITKESEASDLMILATHGRGGVRRFVLGSVADKVIRGSRAPVLVYRPS